VSDSDDNDSPFQRIAAEIIERHRDRLEAATPAAAPPPDPAAARARWLGDRVALLREGQFPDRLVCRYAAGELADTQAMRHAREFMGGDWTVLALTGGVGSGKTLAAMHVAVEAGGSRPGFIRSTRFERMGRYERELQAWLDARTMLVLDDVGVEFLDGKGAYLSLLDELVDQAWGDRRRLVITANLSPTELAKRVGERVWSRIADVGMVGQCGGEDMRRVP
jgi:hypothetical protein